MTHNNGKPLLASFCPAAKRGSGFDRIENPHAGKAVLSSIWYGTTAYHTMFDPPETWTCMRAERNSDGSWKVSRYTHKHIGVFISRSTKPVIQLETSTDFATAVELVREFEEHYASGAANDGGHDVYTAVEPVQNAEQHVSRVTAHMACNGGVWLPDRPEKINAIRRTPPTNPVTRMNRFHGLRKLAFSSA